MRRVLYFAGLQQETSGNAANLPTPESFPAAAAVPREKILVIRFSSIGDIVLTTPVLRAIRAQRPEAELHFLTKIDFRAVVANNPRIHTVHYLEDDLEKTITQLKKEKFTFIADLHHNLRTLRVKKAMGAVEAHSFPKLNIQKWIFTNLRSRAVMPDQSIVERYFEAVRPLGVRNDGGGLEYYIPENARTDNEDIPASHWAGYVACVIGGSYATKKLPAAQWRKFCGSVPYPVILLGGIDDRDEGAAIAEGFGMKVYNACGKFSLNESAHLIERSRVVVSNDTGLMHIAAALNKPVVSLWGNTAPELGMFPYYGGNNLRGRVSPLSVIVENERLSCHPCSKLGYGRCPRGHFKCMLNLDMQTVVNNVQKYWIGFPNRTRD